MKIALTGALLVAVIALAHPCGDAVSHFVMHFDNGSGSASPAQQMPKPGKVDVPQHYEHLTPSMTEDQTKAAVQRELDRAKAAGSGSN